MQYAGPHIRNGDVYGVAVRLDPWFVTGLAEGEGCFCVSFATRPTLKVGLEARPSFLLSLNERDRDLLGDLQAFFECGWIRESRSDRTFKFEARSVRDLLDRICPHFEAYPLRGAKWRSLRVCTGLPDDRTRRSSATGGDVRDRSDRLRDEPRKAPAFGIHAPTGAQ
jgi:hypothetical protein